MARFALVLALVGLISCRPAGHDSTDGRCPTSPPRQNTPQTSNNDWLMWWMLLGPGHTENNYYGSSPSWRGSPVRDEQEAIAPSSTFQKSAQEPVQEQEAPESVFRGSALEGEEPVQADENVEVPMEVPVENTPVDIEPVESSVD